MKKIIELKLRDICFHRGMLLDKMSSQPKDQKQSMLDTLLANIIHSSAIEGEKLTAFSVRSSLANKLGLSEEKSCPTASRHLAALVLLGC